MGVIFLEHIGGARLFSCASCDTNLTNRSQLVSTRFTGATGRAFLFNKVVNLNYRCVYSVFLICSIRNMYETKFPSKRNMNKKNLTLASLHNLTVLHSEVQDRVMLTGRHMVRDVSCKNCDAKLGWVYEFATDEQQRYKEGRVILERALVTESGGLSENI